MLVFKSQFVLMMEEHIQTLVMLTVKDSLFLIEESVKLSVIVLQD